MGVERIKIPGKVMLSGEYAVLEGGKAVLAPVNRYLIVEETETAEQEYTSPVITCALNEEIPEIAEFEAAHGKPHIRVNREEFYTVDQDGKKVKLGLGSSAAEAVGIIALRFQRSGLYWRSVNDKVALYADSAHRRAQNGKGSGADIYTCAIGQPIVFQRINNVVHWKQIEIDQKYSLTVSLLWTGVPADTRFFVNKFYEWKEKSSESDRLIKGLIEASNTLAENWFMVPQDVLNNHIDVFVCRMQEIAQAADFSWRLPIHNELSRWMFEYGGRAKPTGAGGGDLTLLVGDCELSTRKELVLQIALSK